MSKFLKVSGITVAVGAALYAGLGYFGVPYVARTVLERFGSTELGRTVAVKDIRFNPWTWRFELEGLSIKSQEGAGYFLTLDELAVDASGATITNMAPVIEEVTVKGLHGTLTWSDENLKEAEKYESKDAPAETAADSALPAFTTDYIMNRDGIQPDRIAIPILDKEANVTYYCTCLLSERAKFKAVFQHFKSK